MVIIEHQNTFETMFKEEELNLFVGAGFSVEARNFNDEKLMVVPELKKRLVDFFGLEKLANREFSWLCAHLQRTRKGELYDFLKKCYSVKTFDQRYESIVKLNFKNIFTTNIDNLIEKISEKSYEGKYVADTAVSGYIENPGINLFKLHGSVTYTFDKDMYFSSQELATAFAKDSSLWHAVSLKVAAHPTLFWGTNVTDASILQMLASVTISGRPSKPKWIVIMPGEERDIDADEFRSLGFKIIRADTNQMLTYLESIIIDAKGKQIVPRDDEGFLERAFPYNCISKIIRTDHPVRPIAEFYQGADPSWGDILRSHIAEISFFHDALKKIQSIGHVHISGPPGCGKTTMLMQLALSSELQNSKLFFWDLLPDQATHLLKHLSSQQRYVVFLDNLADNLEAYKLLTSYPNITLVTSERDLVFEQIKHITRITPSHIVDISDLPDRDIQNICNSMQRSTVMFEREKVSLFEIVYRLWSGSQLRKKIERLITDIKKSSPELLEFYALMTYVRYCHISATMDMLFSYYSDSPGFDYQQIYDKVEKLSSLVDSSSYQNELEQDSFTLRSRVFSEVSLRYIPADVLAKTLVRFHSNIYQGLVRRYDVFRKKAYDADLTVLAFPQVEQGKSFYESLISKDRSPYVKHQFAIYLQRKGDVKYAWEQIDAAYTQTRGEVYSIGNTHAVILFQNNINKTIDTEGIARATIRQTFSVLEKCLKYDDRKSYHVKTYAEHSLQYYEKYHDEEAVLTVTKALEYIIQELKKEQYMPGAVVRTLNDLKRRLDYSITKKN